MYEALQLKAKQQLLLVGFFLFGQITCSHAGQMDGAYVGEGIDSLYRIQKVSLPTDVINYISAKPMTDTQFAGYSLRLGSLYLGAETFWQNDSPISGSKLTKSQSGLFKFGLVLNDNFHLYGVGGVMSGIGDATSARMGFGAEYMTKSHLYIKSEGRYQANGVTYTGFEEQYSDQKLSGQLSAGYRLGF
jgi:hypothetical protein